MTSVQLVEKHGIVVPMATVNLFYRSGVPRRRIDRERSARARLCAAEDDARDGSWRGVRRENFRAVGRS